MKTSTLYLNRAGSAAGQAGKCSLLFLSFHPSPPLSSSSHPCLSAFFSLFLDNALTRIQSIANVKSRRIDIGQAASCVGTTKFKIEKLPLAIGV